MQLVGGAASGQDAEQYLTAKQASELLGIGSSAVRERIRQGKLPAEKKGRDWRIPLDAMLRADGGPRYSALILTELLAQRVAAHLRGDAEVSGHETATSPGRYGFVWEIADLRERLGEEKAKREMAEREVERLGAELAALRASARE
jgi:excisionase family DNA binding protein